MTMTLLVLFLLASGYAAGRLHQWRRSDPGRAAAYRDGYETAFSLAVRVVSPPVTSTGRHLAPDELVHAPTHRLAPDRIARAKVIPSQREPRPS